MDCQNCNIAMKEYPWGYLCEECGHTIREKHTVGKDLWFYSAFDNFFAVISHEYRNVHNLLEEGKIAGSFLQIKDLLEVILKFPVVVEMANLYQKQKKEAKDYELLARMLKEPLSMGTWRELIQKLMKLEGETIFPSNFLNAVFIMFNKEHDFIDHKCDIVKWRNDKIGHGAYSIDDKKMKRDIELLLRLIKQHFNDYEDVYRQMNVKLLNQELILKGYDNAKDFSDKDLELRYQRHDGTFISLYPFLVIRRNQIFIFDSFLYGKSKYDILSYPVALKLAYKNDPMRESLKKIYDECRDALKNSDLLKSITLQNELDIHHMLRQQEKAITEDTMDIQEVGYLNSWLDYCVNKSGQQKFLLLMQSGMGKTTWARYLSKNRVFDNIIVKTIPMNDTYYATRSAILSKLNREVNTDRDGRYLFEDSENRNIQLNASDLSKELADYLAYYQKLYHAGRIGDKLLIIFDGLDEAGFGEDRNIIQVISKMEQIPENIYFLFTGRTYEEMEHLPYKKNLERLGIDEECSISLQKDDDCYIDLLCGYLKSRYGIESKDFQKKILSYCDNDFATLQLFMEIVIHSNVNHMDEIPHKSEILKGYLEMLAGIYGQKYCGYLYHILHVLSINECPITLEELAYILGDNQITPMLIGYIHDIRRLLDIDREEENNTYKLYSRDYAEIIKEYLQDNAATIIEEFEQNLMERIDGFDSNGFSYLLANIRNFTHAYRCLMEQHTFDEEFFQKMYDYAKDLIHQFNYNKTVRGYEILENYQDVDFEITKLDFLDDKTEEDRNKILDIVRRTSKIKILEQLSFQWSDIYRHEGVLKKLRESAEFIMGTLKEMTALEIFNHSGMSMRILEAYLIVMRQMAFYLSSHNQDKESLEIYEHLYSFLKDKYTNDSPRLVECKRQLCDSLLFAYMKIASTSFSQEKDQALARMEELKLDRELLLQNSKEENDIIKSDMDSLNEIILQLILDNNVEALSSKVNQIRERFMNEQEQCADDKIKYQLCEGLELCALIYLRQLSEYYAMQDDYKKVEEYVSISKDIFDRLELANYRIKNEMYTTFYHTSALANGRLGRFEACIDDNKNLLKTLEKNNSITDDTEYNRCFTRYFAYNGLATMYQKVNPPRYQEACDHMLMAAECFQEFSKVYKTGGMSERRFDNCKNDFLNDIMRLLVAVELNYEDNSLSNILYQLLIDFEVDKGILEEVREKRKKIGTSAYVIADAISGEFILCSGNQRPKRYDYNEKKGTLWLDFKRKCNSCIYKDCSGYQQSGTFEMKVKA